MIARYDVPPFSTGHPAANRWQTGSTVGTATQMETCMLSACYRPGYMLKANHSLEILGLLGSLFVINFTDTI